jgi:chaperone required for assembly of F1-ATPase
MSAESQPKRHYSSVAVAPADKGFAVTLDGRTPRSPAGRPLVLPTESLADVVAEEWAAQGERVDFATMPATRLAHVALDAAPRAHGEMAGRLAEYAAHDLLCYFADAPTALVVRQEAAWSPQLAWARDELGLTFATSASITHVEQPPRTLEAVRDLAAALDDFSLTGLVAAAQLFSSVILALALQRGRLEGGSAFALSQLDETFQAEQWGEDAEAAQRRVAMAKEAKALEAWFKSTSPIGRGRDAPRGA